MFFSAILLLFETNTAFNPACNHKYYFCYYKILLSVQNTNINYISFIVFLVALAHLYDQLKFKLRIYLGHICDIKDM